MAKKISRSDLFEQEDLFKGIRDSATKTLAVFNELQAELKATTQVLKSYERYLKGKNGKKDK